MGKMFNRKNRLFLNKEENNEIKDDEIDDDELESAEPEEDVKSESVEPEGDEENDDEPESAEPEGDEENDDEPESVEPEDDEENDDEPESDEPEGDEENDDESESAEPEGDEVEDDGSKSEEAEGDEAEEDKLIEVEENEAENDETEGDETEVGESESDEEMSLTDDDSGAEDRRSYRRKRRIKNQIIAYGVASVILAVLIVVGVIAGNKISDYVKEKMQTKEAEAQLENEQEELEQQEQQEQEEKPAELMIETPLVDDIIEVPTYEEQLDEYVNKCISEMPLEDRIASLFIVTPEALTGVNTVTQAGDATKEALSKYSVGGLVYFSKNIQSREQLTEMLSTTASNSKYPIFFAVDEEGGSVSRIANSSIDVVKVDEMSVIGTSQDAMAAREAGTTIGTYLKELGFNLDFAPVADVVTDTKNSVLGSRSFGTDAAVAADMVSNVVEGMQAAGVNACLKHFPGLGSAEEDTHEGRVETTRTLEEMRSSDFLPFQAGIEAGANIVMVSHVTASSVDTESLPSSLSKVIITDVLRGELGFEGVVITDALNMVAISDYYTAEEAAVMAIKAGADMLLMPEDFEAAYNGLLLAVQEGRMSEERINESLRRIYRIKYADRIQ